MKTREIMKTEVITLAKDLSCKEAARILLENRISGAPVVDEQGELCGVVSEKDIFRGIFPSYGEFYENPEAYLDFEELEQEALGRSARKIEEVMSGRSITSSPETPVLEIGAKMIASGIHRVPVVQDGKLVGIVSRRDIYRAIMRKYLGLQDVVEKERVSQVKAGIVRKSKSRAKKSK